jgi:hypothetical protein
MWSFFFIKGEEAFSYHFMENRDKIALTYYMILLAL